MLLISLIASALASHAPIPTGGVHLFPMPQGAAQAPAAPAEQSMRQLFPMASEGLTIGRNTPLVELINEYARITGQTYFASPETLGLLSACKVGLSEEVSVPRDQVQLTLESILRHSNLALRVFSSNGPRMFALESLLSGSRTTLRSGAHFLAAEEIDIAKQHPAMLFSTTLNLPNTDVRQLSNSLRSMITDANTQQILPAGASNSMVLVGFGDEIWATAKRLERIDRLQGEEAKKRMALSMVRFELKHAVANDSVAMLTQLVGTLNGERWFLPSGTRVIADERTNALIVRASEAQIESFRAAISLLDVESK